MRPPPGDNTLNTCSFVLALKLTHTHTQTHTHTHTHTRTHTLSDAMSVSYYPMGTRDHNGNKPSGFSVSSLTIYVF